MLGFNHHLGLLLPFPLSVSLHIDRMYGARGNLFSQRSIDQLLPLNWPLAFKNIANCLDIEMTALSLYCDLAVNQCLLK